MLTEKLDHVWSCLHTKAMRKVYVFNNIIYQKYEPTPRSFYSFVCYQFAIYFYVGSIGEESTEDMEKKNLDLLQLIIPEIMRIQLAFSYFPTYSEIWSPPVLPLPQKVSKFLQNSTCVKLL